MTENVAEKSDLVVPLNDSSSESLKISAFGMSAPKQIEGHLAAMQKQCQQVKMALDINSVSSGYVFSAQHPKEKGSETDVTKFVDSFKF